MQNEITGRAKGGKAASDKLTPEQRTERASKGAKARWSPKDKPEVTRGLSEGMAAAVSRARQDAPSPRFAPPYLMPGVVPVGRKSAIAMDECGGVYDFANQAYGSYNSFQPFPGYPYLANLTTRGEYRQMAETMATELTREWISFKGQTGADGEGDQDTARIAELEAAIKEYDLQGKFKVLATHDALFGRGQLSINIKGADEQLPLVLSPKTIKQGALQGFSCIEAMWTTPVAFNATDPTATTSTSRASGSCWAAKSTPAAY